MIHPSASETPVCYTSVRAEWDIHHSGPLPLPSTSVGLDMYYCSKERFLPAVTSSAHKDNTSSCEAMLDGCTASLRLMDTLIHSTGAVDCVWPLAKCRSPVFKHVSTLPLRCTLLRPGESMCYDSNSASQYIPAAPQIITWPLFIPNMSASKRQGSTRGTLPLRFSALEVV